MFGLSTLMTRITIGLIAAVLVLGFLQVRSCQQSRQRAVESRVERAQGKAAHESAKDAISSLEASQARETASEELTAQNEKEIRNAEGAIVQVGAGVNDAGVRALCLRDAYRNTDRCRLLRADTK